MLENPKEGHARIVSFTSCLLNPRKASVCLICAKFAQTELIKPTEVRHKLVGKRIAKASLSYDELKWKQHGSFASTTTGHREEVRQSAATKS